MKRRYGFTVLIVGILTLLLMLTMFPGWTWLALINAVSMASLLLVLAGGGLFIVGGGFFSGISYSFRRFFKKTSESWKALDEIEEDDDFRPTTYSFSMTVPFLVVGMVLFGLTLGISFLFF